MNLDIYDPSVDPKELFFKFNQYLQEEAHRGLNVNNKFTDFTMLLWVYENSNPREVTALVINDTETLRTYIQRLLAVWIEAGWLEMSYHDDGTPLFSFTRVDE